MKRLDGKVAIITGGSSGIGLATAKELQSEGAKIVIFARTALTLDEAEKELKKTGDVLAVLGDMGKQADLDNLLKQTNEKYGKIDILVLNAGIAKGMPFEGVTEELIDETFNINFKGPYFTIQKALPILNDKASIVLITSISNIIGQHSLSVYAASKAALRSLARTLSRELYLTRGIRVNAISPGLVVTPILEKAGLSGEQAQEMIKMLQEFSPMKRPGQPSEIAKAVVFLASEESSYMIGEEIVIDGGQSTIGSV